ncbi:MAG: hypothetical protein P9L89_04580 [Candidatus Celaenobacter polaris]|nr:hypothetical protein [Candidatus Celaenobacter polaris]
METKKMLKRVKSEVGNVLSKVANKAEVVAKISKLKLGIAKKNAKINSNLKDIGEYVYSKKKEFLNDSYIADMFKEVDGIKQSIEDIKAKIEDIKILHKEKYTSIDKHHKGDSEPVE